MSKRRVLCYFLLCFAAAGCSSGGSIVSMRAFYDIPIGATESETVASLGRPYSVHERADGTVEYEYIERIKEGERTIEERCYTIVLKDGKVVSKKVNQDSPPGYLFDSYQMQTTENK